LSDEYVSGALPAAPSANRPLLGAGLMNVACALVAATTLMAKVLGRGLDGDVPHPPEVSAGHRCWPGANA